MVGIFHVGDGDGSIGHAVVHHGVNGHRDRVFGEDLKATTIIILPFCSKKCGDANKKF